jgi:predicted site-specific integrase-resolvase
MKYTTTQGREIGYARVSKTEQHLALQLDALKKRQVIRIFTDKQTGTRFDRKEFLAALDYLNAEDTLVVWKLDRLGRSLKQLKAFRSARSTSFPSPSISTQRPQPGNSSFSSLPCSQCLSAI